MEQDAAQLVCTVTRGSEVLGYVVIDSTVGGRACGGLRMLPDIDEAEVRGLARAMTLKYGFLGLPQGGAKSGVRGDPEAPPAERRERLTAFGQAIAPLLRSRVYTPGADMGTTNAEIRTMLAAVGAPVRRRELRGEHSGDYTALTVLAGARRALEAQGRPLSGRTVAIEGFGSVGRPLARLFAEAGARVVAVSTSRGALFHPRGLDVDRLSRLATEKGSRLVEAYADAERLDRAALLELPVDVLCPCARHDTLHAANAPRVAARIVCSGANNPVTPEAERILFERGVLCLPDFVTNCGGVLGGTMEFASIGRSRIAAFIEHRVGARIAGLLAEAARRSVPPREVAVALARSRSDDARRARGVAPCTGLFHAGLELYRRGWVPRPVVAALAPVYFERRLA